MKRFKLLLFALISTLLFFVVLELVLAAVGVPTLLSERDPFRGFSDRVRVYQLDEAREIYRTPPRAIKHSFNYQEFDAVKPENGLRVFVLGGSSAYGFPWDARIAFSGPLHEALGAAFPERSVETINAAAMSYGSHRLRILTPELLSHEADLLVIYGGHNEFVERRFYREMLDRREGLDPLRGLLHRWRLYALLTRAWERPGQSAEPQPGESSAGELLGLDVNREFEGEVGPEETARVATDFEENLRAILEMAAKAGVPVVLCTVPSNLRDWAPNQSFFAADLPPDRQREVTDLVDRARSSLESGDPRAAVELLERARSLAPAYAETHYRLGRAYAALGRAEEARRAWVAARDTDGQPSRAISALNDTIRRLGAGTDVVLVDVEADFDAASAPRVPGFDLFEDYVHPNPEAHRRIAFEVWRAILENGLAGAPTTADPEKFQAALSPARPTGSDSMDLLFNLALVLENQGHDVQAMEKYRECLRIEPRHHAARMNLARLLHRAGRNAEAVDQYRLALPAARTSVHHAAVLVGLGDALLAMGRTAEALDALTRATDVDPGFAHAWGSLGSALAAENRHAEAERAFGQATVLDPDDVEVLTNLGFALLFQGDFDDAQKAFEQGLEHDPRHARARNGFAAVLTEQGDLDRAERIFRENLDRDPQDDLARGGLDIIRERRNR